MATGNARVQLPIAKAVGAQHQPVAANQAGPALPQVSVPPPSPLLINGRVIIIDVRTMSNADVVVAINSIPGVLASIDGQGRLVITGIDKLDGDPNLRAILGI